MDRNEQKAATRQRILEAAGRSFRKGGYGGVGVDGLSKEAGVTSGAFYVHFDSKAAAFKETVQQGVQDVAEGIERLQATEGPEWWAAFVRFYLQEKRACELAESCGMQSLASEVARADADSRDVFTEQLMRVTALIVAGAKLGNAPQTPEEAHAALASLIGAVTLARAVNDARLAQRIANAAEKSLVPFRSDAPAHSRHVRTRSR